MWPTIYGNGTQQSARNRFEKGEFRKDLYYRSFNFTLSCALVNSAGMVAHGTSSTASSSETAYPNRRAVYPLTSDQIRQRTLGDLGTLRPRIFIDSPREERDR